MKKKLLGVLLSLAMALNFTVVSAFAVEKPTITVETAANAVEAGATVALSVSIEGNTGFTNYEWDIQYDKDRLELTTINSEFDIISNPKHPKTGFGYATWARANSYENDTELFTLTFTVKEDAKAGNAEVKIVSDNFKNNGVAIDADYVVGGVTVNGSTGGPSAGGGSTGGPSAGGGSTGGPSAGGGSTGGPSAGGGSTGGPSAGGGSTGGSETDAINVSNIGINPEYFDVVAQTVTVTYSLPCKVGYFNNGKYVALEATANPDGSYSYTAPEGVTELMLVVKGDANGDGKVTVADISQLLAHILQHITMDEASQFAANADGNSSLSVADISTILAHILHKSTLEW